MSQLSRWFLVLSLFLAACQGPERAWQAPEMAVDDVANGLVSTQPAHDAGAASDSFAEAGKGRNVATKPQADPAAERYLVHRGAVRVEVANADDAISRFQAQTKEWGGHLQSLQNRTLVVRIPSARFEEAFAWVRQLGRVLSESREAQDVTEEFLDLGIRIDNARKGRERLLEVLQRAEKVEDILRVEAEIRRLTEEIERMEGRRKYLADQVAMSTLSVTFQPVTEPPPVKHRRRASEFRWVNLVGAEQLMENR